MEEESPQQQIERLATENGRLKSILNHPTYGEMVTLIEEIREDQKRGYAPRIGQIGAMYWYAAEFAAWRRNV